MSESTLVGNGVVFTLQSPEMVIRDGGVLFKDGVIEEIGRTADLQSKANHYIDAEGRVIMPGLICAHHHLYSTFACGISAAPASNFVEVLENLWWKLDRALDLKDVELSALIPLARCISSGTTTIIDHHASPEAIEGSLSAIGDAVRQAGIRASLCYEVTDRNGEQGARTGIAENVKWLEQCKTFDRSMLHGLVGVHASMTVSDATLSECVKAANDHSTGLHIHVAESEADQVDSVEKYGKRVIQRLNDLGGLGENSIAVHCIHIDDDETKLLSDSGTIVIHNPQSNMNNAVGCAAVPDLLNRGVLVALGTDGMTSNMLEEARASLFVRHHVEDNPSSGFGETVQMLFENNGKIATRFFGKKLGVLEPGAAADIVIADYVPFTPVHNDNVYGHILFGIAATGINSTICNGQLLMHDKKLKTLNIAQIARQAFERTPQTWQRFQSF